LQRKGWGILLGLIMRKMNDDKRITEKISIAHTINRERLNNFVNLELEPHPKTRFGRRDKGKDKCDGKTRKKA
jgi:hypothetical protein